MFLHSLSPAGLGTLGITVRCSVFHLAGHRPVRLTSLKTSATGSAKDSGNRRTRWASGSPSTRDSVFFAPRRSSVVRSRVKLPRPPHTLDISRTGTAGESDMLL